MLLAASMGVLAVITLVGAIVDPREVLGSNLWFKPLKFELSIGIYAVSLAWLIGLLNRRQRLFWILGTVSAIGLAIEMVVIGAAAVLGTTSHFNVSTPLQAGLWSVMAASITLVWVIILLVSVALFRADLGDRARTVAIRSGAILAVVGMGLAFLMTSPNAQQLADYQGIAGAHAVGIADGGPGIPILGWSTVGGDLRIPHFVGMHALQFFPLLALGLEFASRRIRVLASTEVRRRIIWVAILGFTATIGVLTLQALSGQSIVQPAGLVLVAGIVVAVATSIALVIAVVLPAREAVQVKKEYETVS